MHLEPGKRIEGTKLTLIKVFSEEGRGYAKVRCDCGTEKVVQTGNIYSGRTTTCGCRDGMNKADRFWSKVSKKGPDKCWDWKGCTDRDGYGRFWDGEKTVTAHHFSFELATGEKVNDPTKDVCHTCISNRVCCNPKHLILGTKPQNVAMRVEQGHNASVLTVDEAREILQLRQEGWALSELAKRFSVSIGAISAVTQRRTFKYVPMPSPRENPDPSSMMVRKNVNADRRARILAECVKGFTETQTALAKRLNVSASLVSIVVREYRRMDEPKPDSEPSNP